MNKIILVGYMGSGKSSVGNLLAQKIKLPFYDLDEIIENEVDLSISEIFAIKGEIQFRKLEHQLFQDFVNTKNEFVLSLGGGTPCYANNHLILQNEGITSIYLKTSIGEIMNRLKKSSNIRPLLLDKSEEQLHEFIAMHLFERSYYYHQSKMNVLTDGKTTEEVVCEIIKKLT